MSDDPGLRAAEFEKIAKVIGRPATASAVFCPRVDRLVIAQFAASIRAHLKIKPSAFDFTCECAELQPQQVTPWATRLWANMISEFALSDPELRRLVESGAGFVPTDPVVQALYNRKLEAGFRFFIWVFGWRGSVGDLSNCFTARFLVLEKVIRIEDLQAKRDGKPSGWGLLDSAINAAENFAATENQRIKTTATNPRIESAFRRRGFVDQLDVALLDLGPNARPLELP